MFYQRINVHIGNSLFASLFLFSSLTITHTFRTYQPIYIQTPAHSPCRRMCNSPKPNVAAAAAVATTELVFFLLLQYQPIHMYSVSQCFQCR